MIDFACKRFSLDEVIKCGLTLSKTELNVFKLMIRKEEWFDTESIARKLDINLTTAQKAVKKLFDAGILLRNQENLTGGGYLFSYKAKDCKVVRKLIMDVIHNWVKKVENEFKSWK